MDAKHRTSLSAGHIVRAVLLEDPGVASRTKKIFPLVIDEAELPYISYRRAELSQKPQKSGQPGSDAIVMELACYAGTYDESLDLAEAVRAALDNISAEHDGMSMRSCMLVDSEELRDGDAFLQQLNFSIQI